MPETRAEILLRAVAAGSIGRREFERAHAAAIAEVRITRITES